MKLSKFLRPVVDLVFPVRCVSCRRLGSDFCQTCMLDVTFVGEDICIRCGQPATERCTCTHCKRTPPKAIRGMRGVLFYHGVVSDAVQALKYEGKQDLAKPLATYLIKYLEAHPLPFDYLVPAPLHPERQAERGFNQSDLLAEHAGAARGIPVRTDLIRRSRNTPPQVKLNRSERQQNMHQAFSAYPNAELDGETILVIDDVCTTGATLQACAQTLREIGAGDIWALTVARALPPHDPEPWEIGLTPQEIFVVWDERRKRAQAQET